MKTEQFSWTASIGWQPVAPGKLGADAQLVLVFGSTSVLTAPGRLDEVRGFYPKARIFGCSTAGEICGTSVSDDSLIVTAVHFEHTTLDGSLAHINGSGSSFEVGEGLAASLPKDDLVHVLVLSDGLSVNGSDLVRGLTSRLPDNVTVTGGLAADGDRFENTVVCWEGVPQSRAVAVLGLYGSRLKVGYGSLGGWDPFGPERLITRSQGNVLYEMDGRSALDLYKTYLGEHASRLPASGLLFPLALRTADDGPAVVRTVLSVDEAEQSMTFAGDLPVGAYVRLMKANFDRLIDGAAGAARTTRESIGASQPDLALLISCVGRKMVLKQRIEEEVEGVRDVLGSGTLLAGFYSYGEISPFTPSARCELHNQTMTITTLTEA